MMRRALFFACLFLMLPGQGEEAAPPLKVLQQRLEGVDGREGCLHLGATTGWRLLRTRSELAEILDREFAYVTPENDFKQHAIHPEPGRWSWEAVDGWIERSRARGQLVRVHGPISPQVSRWVMDDRRTPEELETMLEEFFVALCQRIQPHAHLRWMDVVNETVTPEGGWFGPKPGVDQWENPWPRIGYDESHPLRPPLYIKRAFEIALEHAPDKSFVINQHGSMEPAMWDKVKALILYLREQGLRVDGLGWQAHIRTGWEKEPGHLDRLDALIRWAHEHELDFHITEIDVRLQPAGSTESASLEEQAETYGTVLERLIAHRHRGVVTWNTWGISDAHHWGTREGWEACLFDGEFQPKPAYFAVSEVVAQAAAEKAAQPGE